MDTYTIYCHKCKKKTPWWHFDRKIMCSWCHEFFNFSRRREFYEFCDYLEDHFDGTDGYGVLKVIYEELKYHTDV